MNRLFKLYFEEGADISEHAILSEAAEEIGMDRPVVERLLAGDADRQMLLDEDRTAREMGVSGVPCFIIGGKYVVQGAQPPDTWAKVIRELVEAQNGLAQQEAQS